ncbi:hypothetical protein ABIB48_002606 [Arthrobacter sp. UYCu511]|uniref:terminase small subunit n=1 Tax=Arthrobacter sp. UYCu511 TaxID=3156337 RepID=UPI003398B4AB
MSEVENTETEQPKKAMGRPLKYQTKDELEVAIDSYFNTQDPHIEERLVESGTTEKGESIFTMRKIMTEQKPYLVSGLAIHLGVTRQTLLNYREREDFFDSIARALGRCEAYAESQLYGSHARGAIFNLQNNYKGEFQDWSDKQSIDHTTGGEPMTALVEFIGGGTKPSTD